MKTPMNVFNTAMKKKKNRKGFSLVELIVVLVIMAILAAALIPSLVGYIKKTKEQNVNSECQSAVQAAQTIESGAFASANSTYEFSVGGKTYTLGSATDVNTTDTTKDAATGIKALSEVPGTVSDVAVDETDHRITALTYTGKDGSTKCYYAYKDGVGTYSSNPPATE